MNLTKYADGRSTRAISLRSERSLSRAGTSAELDTVHEEERSDPEQTQVSAYILADE